MSEAPTWLADFQRRFGAALRTPLDRSSGTLTVSASAHDPELRRAVRGVEGLAAYNRQYWLRLFTVAQDHYPVTTRLLGAWAFNGLASEFLLARPPRHWDVDSATAGFGDWLLATQEALPDLVREGVRVDDAWLAMLRAPTVEAWTPTATEVGRLPALRLRRAPSAVLVRERWPLLELRAALARGAPDPAPGPPHPAPRSWLLIRRERVSARVPLDPREADLLELLETHPLGVALARLEATYSPDERTTLPALVRGWLERGMRLGIWTGTVNPSPQTTQL